MRYICIIIALFVFVGCHNKVDQLDLPLLNGYWEIEKVTFPDGSEKEYSVNTSVDYIEVKDQNLYQYHLFPLC